MSQNYGQQQRYGNQSQDYRPAFSPNAGKFLPQKFGGPGQKKAGGGQQKKRFAVLAGQQNEAEETQESSQQLDRSEPTASRSQRSGN